MDSNALLVVPHGVPCHTIINSNILLGKVVDDESHVDFVRESRLLNRILGANLEWNRESPEVRR
jgi:hypothetical protein